MRGRYLQGRGACVNGFLSLIEGSGIESRLGSFPKFHSFCYSRDQKWVLILSEKEMDNFFTQDVMMKFLYNFF